MKKTFIRILVILLFILNFNFLKANAIPSFEAQGVVLLDGITGEILYEKNSHTQYEPASTTKVMTALIVLENCKLDDNVTIGDYPPLVDGSALGIKTGEVYTVRELMYGLLLESANDCAEALGQHIAGSNAAFAELMTKKAKELGANDTIFKNPSGLHEPGHVTTAYDLALIMKAALSNKDFIEISRKEAYFYKNQPFSDGTEKWASNRNQCLNEYSPYFYDYLYSGKNGYTPEANHAYTAAAKKDDQFLVCAVLNGYDKNNLYTNVGPLFNWGFDNFTTKKIVSKDSEVAKYKINDNITLPLLADRDIYFTRKISDNEPIVSVNYEDLDITKQPIQKGEKILKATVSVNDTHYEDLTLLSGIDRDYTKKIEINETIYELKKNKLLFNSLIIIGILIISLLVFASIRLYRLHKSKNKCNNLTNN